MARWVSVDEVARRVEQRFTGEMDPPVTTDRVLVKTMVEENKAVGTGRLHPSERLTCTQHVCWSRDCADLDHRRHGLARGGAL